MALVQPVATMAAWFESIGDYVALNRGQAYDTDDPLVRERPDLFDRPVEQATAAPGEKRSTRRTSSTQ